MTSAYFDPLGFPLVTHFENKNIGKSCSTKVLEPTVTAVTFLAPNQGARFPGCSTCPSVAVTGAASISEKRNSPQTMRAQKAGPNQRRTSDFRASVVKIRLSSDRDRRERFSNHLEQIVLGEGLFQQNISKVEAARSYVFTGIARHENSFQARPERAQ